MRSLLKITTAFSLAFMLMVCAPSKTVALEDAILAIVNDEVITLKDLRSYIHATYVSLVAEGLEESQLKEIMLDLEINGINKLIEDKLILSEANKLGLIVNEKILNERYEEIKSRYPSEQVFEEALAKNLANITELKAKLTEQLKIRFVIDSEVRSKIYINPQEITEYYTENIDKFKNAEKVKLDSIFISYEDNKVGAIAKANEARSKITGGADFLEIAKQYSDTASIGMVERGQLISEIEDQVFNLNEAEVSPIIETDAGAFIFKMNKKVPAQTASVLEVEEQISRTIFRKKFKAKFDKWLAKLKKDAYIEIKQ